MGNDIFQRIENSKKADFGDILSKSFDLYKKHFTQGLIHSLVAFAIMIPLLIVVYIPLVPIYADMIQHGGDPGYTPEILEQYSLVMIIGWYILIFLLSFIMQAVNMSVYGHFFRYMKKDDLGTNQDIGGYFTLLQENFGKLVLLSLAMMGIAILATALCYLPIFYAMVPLHWIFPVFIFNRELSVSDTVKAAFKFGNKNWGIFFGLGIVCGIISSLGAIACYVGLFATMFFQYIATYVAYRETIGFGSSEEKEVETF